MSHSLFLEKAFLHYKSAFFQLNAESGEFKANIFGQECYFEATNYHEKIKLHRRIEEILTIEKKLFIPEVDFLNLYGTLFNINTGEDSFEVTNYLAQIAAPQSNYYNQHLRLGYLEKNESYYLFRKINPYSIYHGGERHHFEKAMLAAGVYCKEEKIIFGPLSILNPYSHPGLASENKEMQTLCLGDIDYTAIRKAYKEDPLKQWLHLFSIGENTLKSRIMKDDCFHPLTKSSENYGSPN